MRYHPKRGRTAADLVSSLTAEALADVFFMYGEERRSRRIARAIVEYRAKKRITTTTELAEIVRKSSPGWHGGIDPATRVFQALRIAVNQELDLLDSILADLPDVLAPGGRAAIISFHSLEDRRVKWAFKESVELRPVVKKPIIASELERANNPRSRSAKLRVFERAGDQPSASPDSKRGA